MKGGDGGSMRGRGGRVGGWKVPKREKINNNFKGSRDEGQGKGIRRGRNPGK